MNVEKSSEIIILHPQNILFMYRMLLVLSVYKYIVLRFLHPPNILVTLLVINEYISRKSKTITSKKHTMIIAHY